MSGMCDWCRNEFDGRQLTSLEMRGQELLSHICPGCYFCWKHGAPQFHDDHPFTDMNASLKKFTEDFFSPIPRKFYKPEVA